jgi:hypothetical protein
VTAGDPYRTSGNNLNADLTTLNRYRAPRPASSSADLSSDPVGRPHAGSLLGGLMAIRGHAVRAARWVGPLAGFVRQRRPRRFWSWRHSMLTVVWHVPHTRRDPSAPARAWIAAGGPRPALASRTCEWETRRMGNGAHCRVCARRYVEDAFAAVQGRLGRTESDDHPGRAAGCTLVAIPSINFDRALLDHHAIAVSSAAQPPSSRPSLRDMRFGRISSGLRRSDEGSDVAGVRLTGATGQR